MHEAEEHTGAVQAAEEGKEYDLFDAQNISLRRSVIPTQRRPPLYQPLSLSTFEFYDYDRNSAKPSLTIINLRSLELRLMLVKRQEIFCNIRAASRNARA